MNDINKKFLKDTFNIDANNYSPEVLDKVLDIINKNLLLKTKILVDKNRSIKKQIDYYESFLESN